MVKLQKTGKSSRSIIIPKFVLEHFGWGDEDNFLITLKRTGVFIEKEKKRDE